MSSILPEATNELGFYLLEYSRKSVETESISAYIEPGPTKSRIFSSLDESAAAGSVLCTPKVVPNAWILYKVVRLQSPCNAPNSCETPKGCAGSWGEAILELSQPGISKFSLPCQKQCSNICCFSQQTALTACFSGPISIYSSFYISSSSNLRNYYMYLSCSLIAKPSNN